MHRASGGPVRLPLHCDVAAVPGPDTVSAGYLIQAGIVYGGLRAV